MERVELIIVVQAVAGSSPVAHPHERPGKWIFHADGMLRPPSRIYQTATNVAACSCGRLRFLSVDPEDPLPAKLLGVRRRQRRATIDSYCPEVADGWASPDQVMNPTSSTKVQPEGAPITQLEHGSAAATSRATSAGARPPDR